MVTTIQLEEGVKTKLDLLKVHPRETYNELLIRIIENCSSKKLDKESLIETIEVLSDSETMMEIAEALQEIEKGNFGKSLNEIEEELGI